MDVSTQIQDLKTTNVLHAYKMDIEINDISDVKFLLQQAINWLAIHEEKRNIEQKPDIKKALEKRRKTRYAKK